MPNSYRLEKKKYKTLLNIKMKNFQVKREFFLYDTYMYFCFQKMFV